eukprot:s225_g35.t1
MSSRAKEAPKADSEKLKPVAKEEPNKACKKAQAEKGKIAKQKGAEMLTLVSKAVADLKKACKKAKDATWGAHELQALTKSRDDLEDLATDGELEGIKSKLLEAAAALKNFKKLLTV